MGAFITHAMNDDGQMVHVDSVPKGIKCGCHCPHCQAPLYAKNGGQIREHHFAHANGHECDGAYESSVHFLAKEVLQETGSIMLPRYGGFGFPTGLVRLRNIEVEKWDERFKIRPDAEGIMPNGERLLIEFNFAHKVDNEKRKIIVDNHLKCIEIDIKYQADEKKELREFLVGSTEDRHWLVELPPPPPPKGESFSISYPRKPIFDQTRSILKEVFENKSLRITPRWGLSFDLKQYGYDTCEIGAKYRGFKADLLLYRSQKEDKGYIAINIRGRRRYEVEKPKNLRVIDIVINPDLKEDFVRKYFAEGVLRDDFAVKIYYFDFK